MFVGKPLFRERVPDVDAWPQVAYHPIQSFLREVVFLRAAAKRLHPYASKAMLEVANVGRGSGHGVVLEPAPKGAFELFPVLNHVHMTSLPQFLRDPI